MNTHKIIKDNLSSPIKLYYMLNNSPNYSSINTEEAELNNLARIVYEIIACYRNDKKDVDTKALYSNAIVSMYKEVVTSMFSVSYSDYNEIIDDMDLEASSSILCYMLDSILYMYSSKEYSNKDLIQELIDLENEVFDHMLDQLTLSSDYYYSTNTNNIIHKCVNVPVAYAYISSFVSYLLSTLIMNQVAQSNNQIDKSISGLVKDYINSHEHNLISSDTFYDGVVIQSEYEDYSELDSARM